MKGILVTKLIMSPKVKVPLEPGLRVQIFVPIPNRKEVSEECYYRERYEVPGTFPNN